VLQVGARLMLVIFILIAAGCESQSGSKITLDEAELLMESSNVARSAVLEQKLIAIKGYCEAGRDDLAKDLIDGEIESIYSEREEYRRGYEKYINNDADAIVEQLLVDPRQVPGGVKEAAKEGTE